MTKRKQKPRTTKSISKESILELINNSNGWMTIKEIADLLELDKTHTMVNLRFLADVDKIEREWIGRKLFYRKKP